MINVNDCFIFFFFFSLNDIASFILLEHTLLTFPVAAILLEVALPHKF